MSLRGLGILAIPACLACSESTGVSLRDGPPANLAVLGRGEVLERSTTEVWAHGDFAYTATGSRATGGVLVPGNAIKIWNVAGANPVLVDSVIVPDAVKLSDIQVSDDGRLLMVSTEFAPGSLVLYDLGNPAKPVFLSRFTNANTNPGVHTAEMQRVNGILHAFLSIDPQGVSQSRLVILDLSDPTRPQEVFARVMGLPFIHDVFVRDGFLFAMLWNDGVEIFDIGGGGRGGSVSSPVSISKALPVGGRVHNGWWYHDASGGKRYLFTGEEGPGIGGTTSSGDIHVLDISDMNNPREVAYFSVPNAGTHNFWMDERRGILYAAYYNGGVRALDVRGDLGTCAADERAADGRCDLVKMKREIATGLVGPGQTPYVWGVHLVNRKLYVSDIFAGLWVLGEVP